MPISTKIQDSHRQEQSFKPLIGQSGIVWAQIYQERAKKVMSLVIVQITCKIDFYWP